MQLRPAKRQNSAKANPDFEPFSLRVRDASHFSGLSRSTLYVLIAQGKIDILKVGRSTLILTSSLKSFLGQSRRTM